MKRTILLCMSIVASFIMAQNIPLDPDVRYGKLENGLTYYIKKNAKPENKVELRLAINAGSLMEDEDQLGLAHFMEHMNFNGTKNFPKNELVDYLQSIGVKFGQHLNAYTSFDETVYMLPIPSDDEEKLNKGLKILEDWAFNAQLTPEEIDKERGVVLEELRTGLGPDKKMLDNYLPKVLYNSRYAERLPIGKKEILENFTYDKIQRFHKDWYRPDLMAVIIVGDINVDDIERKIKANFSSYKNPSNERKRENFEVPFHKETLVAIESDPDASFSQIQLLYKDLGMPKVMKTEQDYKQMLVENLFSSMLNNRLQELADGPNPPFTYGYTYHGGTWARTKEAFQSFAMSQEGKQLEALKVLLSENERVRQHGFTQSELDRVKAEQLSYLEKAYNERDKSESRRLVGEFINHFLEQEPAPGIKWEFDKTKQLLPQITLEDVNGLIANYLRKENRVVVFTGPDKPEITQPTEGDVLSLMEKVSSETLEPYNDEVAIKELVAVDALGKGSKIKKEYENKKLGTHSFVLKNGIKVTYKKTDFKNDEIRFQAVSLGGTSLVDNDRYNKAAYAIPALDEAGLNGYTKTDLSKFLSGKVASVSPSIGETSESLSGNCVPKDFETMMQLIYSYFTGLNKDENAYKSYKDKMSGIYSNIKSRPDVFFQLEMYGYLYQNDPRFKTIPITQEDWDNTDYNTAYEVYKERFANAADFEFFFVGNVDEKALKELSQKYLGNLKTDKKKVESFKDLGYRPLFKGETKVFKKGKEQKSNVVIQYSGETEYNQREDLIMDAIGQIARIKIIEDLREEEGGIYSGRANGNISKTPYGSYEFSMNFPCGPENVDKLIEKSKNIVQNLINNGPDEKDLNKFKEAEDLEYKEKIKENGTWLGVLVREKTQGFPAEGIFSYMDKVNSITAKEVQDVAKKYLSKEPFVAVLMPEEIIEEPTAKAADISPETVLNNYWKAIGGKDKLEAVKSISKTTSMSVMGMVISIKEMKMKPNLLKIEVDQMGQKYTTVYNGTEAYALTPQGRQEIPVDEFKKAPFLIMSELELSADAFKSVSEVDMDGKSYLLLDDGTSKYYFDSATFMLAIKDGPLPNMGQGKTHYKEYTTIKGIKQPTKFTIEAMGQQVEATNEIILDEGLSKDDFN